MMMMMMMTAQPTDIESAVGDDSMRRLRDVGRVNKIVIRVSVLAVALLHH